MTPWRIFRLSLVLAGLLIAACVVLHSLWLTQSGFTGIGYLVLIAAVFIWLAADTILAFLYEAWPGEHVVALRRDLEEACARIAGGNQKGASPFAPAGTRRKFLGCRFFEKQVVAPDDPAGPLLVRWILFRAPFLGCYLHKLNRSDHDRALHDHPWNFITVVLRRGYTECYEVTDRSSHDCRCMHSVVEHARFSGMCTVPWCSCDCFEYPVRDAFVFHPPLIPFFRPAEWKHRVIIHGRPAWTLVFVFRRRRAWGFWTDKGWCWWRKYDASRGICEDGILHTSGRD